MTTPLPACALFQDSAKSRPPKQPTAMRLHEITPKLILAFLVHFEHERGNLVRSRNARLAALRAFLKFAGRRDVTALHVVEQRRGRGMTICRTTSPTGPGFSPRPG